ncbi:BRO family protein [Sphingomonas hankookensis]|uniref:BRO family protein n=1 Tax=Sphingomonas hankookensis TaxID=563996 RepID=UPI00234F4B74|nr:BRO family protein [Sphingomonas hankookensis]WCP71548.1 BRO family protein [Sphingomonas hankookensis]
MSAVALQSFGFGEQLVRATDRGGMIWLVAKDVCAALNIANHHDAVAKLDEDEKSGVALTDPHGREQNTTIISEGGAYTLVLRCRDAMKPGSVAHRFRKWLTNEVLPAIRTTGRYDGGVEIVTDAPEPLADETERLRLQLGLVREARIAFGTRGARRAWAIAGLPDLGLAEASPILSGAVAVIGKLHQSVADWLDNRTEAAPGHRVPSMVLYHDYLDWAKREGVSRNDVVSLSAFGRVLSNCGIGAIRSNVMHRIGLRLID